MAVNNWVGYEADAFVVGQVAKKRLGCLVNYVYVDEQISWQGFAQRTGRRGARELGPRGADRPLRQAAARRQGRRQHRHHRADRLVRPAVDGQEVPRHPGLEEPQQVLQAVQDQESGGKGQLLDGDPGFVTNDEALVKNLKLNYKVVFAGSEAALIQAFRAGEARKKPVLGYFYSPQWFLAEVPLKKVKLPPYKAGLRRRRGEGRLRLPGLPAAQDRQQPVRRRRTRPATGWSRTSSGPTTTRTWSRSTSPRTACSPRRPPRSGSTTTRRRSTPGCRA